jgi:hypothetical protein
MRSDVTYSHSRNVGEQVGDFCGVPICTMDMLDLEVDELLDAQRVVFANQLSEEKLGPAPFLAEVLPGEEICTDNRIRRSTAGKATLYPLLGRKETLPTFTFAEDGTLMRLEQNKVEKIYNTETSTWEAIINAKPSVTPKSSPVSKFVTLAKPQPELTVADYIRMTQEDKTWKDSAAKQAAESNLCYVPVSSITRIIVGGTALLEAKEMQEEVQEKVTKQDAEVALECEWYPDGETLCGKPTTHPRTAKLASVCDACYNLREQRSNSKGNA